MNESALTAEKYAHWLKPGDALKRLPEDWGRGHAITAIITQLKVGAILAVARHGLLETDEGEQSVELYPVDRIFWDDSQWMHGPEALWVTGQVSFRRGSRLAEVLGRLPEKWTAHTFVGVRFDPAMFAIAFDFGGVLDPPEIEDRSELPALSDSALASWAALFREVYPTGSEALARGTLDGMFPDKFVSRARLRRIMPERGRGRPLKEEE